MAMDFTPVGQSKNEQLNKVVTDLIQSINDTTNRLIFQLDENIHLTINSLLEIWLSFTEHLLNDPEQISDAQITYWQDYLVLCEDLHKHLSINQVHQDTHWKDPILMAFAEKFYFLLSKHARVLLKNIFDVHDSDEKLKLEFYHKKFVEAFAQANFKNDVKLVDHPAKKFQ